jgi:Flp pilus assembly protein TadD
VYISEVKYDDAIRELRKAASIGGNTTEPITQLGYALARSGNQEEARQTLEDLTSLGAKFYVPSYSFAMIYNGLGEKDLALRYLEKSLDEREVQITFIKIDRRWDALRAEPRFVNLMHRVGFGT